MTTDERFLKTIALVMPILRQVGRQDRNLASQARRALQSAALQHAEAMDARGGNRDAKLQGALAEAKEARFALRIAVASGYVETARLEGAIDAVDHLAATLYLKLHRPFR